MQILTHNIPWPIDNKLCQLLLDEVAKSEDQGESGFVLSFRDPDYSPEAGGFHPVEIAIAPDGSVLYVTDFAYVGRPPRCELTKEIDFDFSLGLLQHFGREYPITTGRELFLLWQSNFLAYYRMGAYAVSVGTL